MRIFKSVYTQSVALSPLIQVSVYQVRKVYVNIVRKLRKKYLLFWFFSNLVEFVFLK